VVLVVSGYWLSLSEHLLPLLSLSVQLRINKDYYLETFMDNELFLGYDAMTMIWFYF